MTIPFNSLLQKPEEQLCTPEQIGSKLTTYEIFHQDELTDVFVKTKLVLLKVRNISKKIYPATIIAALAPQYAPLIIESSYQDSGMGLGRVISIALKGVVCLMKMTDDYQNIKLKRVKKPAFIGALEILCLIKFNHFWRIVPNCIVISYARLNCNVR